MSKRKTPYVSWTDRYATKVDQLRQQQWLNYDPYLQNNGIDILRESRLSERRNQQILQDIEDERVAQKQIVREQRIEDSAEQAALDGIGTVEPDGFVTWHPLRQLWYALKDATEHGETKLDFAIDLYKSRKLGQEKKLSKYRKLHPDFDEYLNRQQERDLDLRNDTTQLLKDAQKNRPQFDFYGGGLAGPQFTADMEFLGRYPVDFWRAHGRKMNDFQIQAAQGYKDRSNLFMEQLYGVQKMNDIDIEIERLNSRIDYLASNQANDPTNTTTQEVTQMAEQIRNLRNQRAQLQQYKDAFDSYIPSRMVGDYYNLMAGNGDNSWIANNFIFGRTTQFHNEMGDILRHIVGYNNQDITPYDRKAKLDAAIAEYKTKTAEWDDVINRNIQDKESYGKPSDWFLRHEKESGTDLFDPKTYIFSMPGLIAGSTSGMSKLLPSMLLSIGTTVATGGASLGVQIGAGVVGGGLAFGLNRAAGVEENNAEVAYMYTERLRDELSRIQGSYRNKSMYDDIVSEGRQKLKTKAKGLTDDEIFDLFRLGKYTVDDPRIDKEMYRLSLGLESAFQDDMGAVTWSAGIETLLWITPVGAASTISKLGKRTLLKTLGRENYRRVAGTAIGKRMAAGFEYGSVVGPTGGLVYAPIHTIVAPVGNKLGSLGRGVSSRLFNISKVSEAVPEEVLRKSFKWGNRKLYMKDIAGRWIKSSIAEGIEEGKQHVSAERYKSGKYNSAIIKGFWDTVLDDFLAGSKSAGLIMGMPFEGLMSEKDREMLQEIKGGMILGGAQTTVINIASQTVPFLRKERANDVILHYALSDKFRKLDLFNKAQAYAQKAKSGTSYQYVLDAFDRLTQANNEQNRRTGEYGVSPETITEEKANFKRIAQLSHDGYTKKQAQAQGIESGTAEYFKFVAAKALAEREVKDSEEFLNDINNDFRIASREVQNKYLTKDLESAVGALEEGEEATSPTMFEEDSEDFYDVTNVANYAALLQRKKELEIGLDVTTNNGNINAHRIIQKWLNTVNENIARLRPFIKPIASESSDIDINNLEDVERELVFDRESHDTLKKLYKDQYAAQDDLELAEQHYIDVVGTPKIKDKESGKFREIKPGEKINYAEQIDNIKYEGGKAKKVIKQIQATIDDDEDLQGVIQRDYRERVAREEAAAEAEEGGVAATEAEPTEEPEGAPAATPEEEFVAEAEDAAARESVAPVAPRAEISEDEEESETAEPAVAPIPEPEDEVEEESAETGTTEEREPRVTPEATSPETKSKFPRTISFAEDPETRTDDGSSSDTSKITPDQQSVIDAIKEEARKSKERTIEVTPEYYLIKVGDEEIKMPRVHSVMPKSWVADDEKGKADTSRPAVTASLQVGGAFDYLARIFFSDLRNAEVIDRFSITMGGKTLMMQDGLDPITIVGYYRDEQTGKQKYGDLFELTVPKLERTFSDLFGGNREEFNNTLLDLYLLAKSYENLGWQLVTDPIVWYQKFARGYVAGETDMVAVDRKGNIHIIDFKTAKGNMPFETFLWNRPNLTEKYFEDLSELSKEDFTAGPRGKGLSKKARAVKSKIGKAQEDNRIILTWNDQTNSAEVNIANSNFYSTNGNMFRLRPKSKEYSDQLTAYKEMIQSTIGDVVDLEIVGFRAAYSIDYKNNGVDTIHSLTNSVNGNPFRIKLSFSDEMEGILNNSGDPVNPIDPIVDSEQKEAHENVETATTTSSQIEERKEIITPISRSEDSLNRPGEVPTVPIPSKRRIPQSSHNNLNSTQIRNDAQLTADVSSPTFIQDALQNGLVEVYTEGTNVYANIQYNGHEYKRIFIWSRTKEREGVDQDWLLQRVKELEEKKKPNQRIVATQMKRTAGNVETRQDRKAVPILETSLLDDRNLHDIEFSSSYGQFGFVDNGQIVTFVDGDENRRTSIFSYNGRGIPVPANGTFTYVKRVKHSEKPRLEYIPVTLTRKSIGEDAEFILDCLRNIEALDRTYTINVDGSVVSVGATRRQLLELLMPYADGIQYVKNTLSIVKDSQHPNVFHIIKKGMNAPLATVDVLNDQSVSNFQAVLNRLSVTERHDVLACRLGDTSATAVPVFQGIRNFFANKKNSKIKSLSISPNLKFDFEDFTDQQSQRVPNKINQGLSGMGWYIKHGVFVTQGVKLGAPLISIQDVDIADNKPTDIPQTSPKTIEEQIKGTNDDVLLDMLSTWGLEKRETEADKNKPKLTKEQVKKNLRPILGDVVDDETFLQFFEDLQYDERCKNAGVVGVAHADGIRIYNSAFSGVEYHEAFHRIFELYVPEHIRDAVYKKIAKRIGVNLAKSTKENSFYEHRLVAEWIADKYMDHKTNKFRTGISIVDRVIDILSDLVNIIAHFNERQLYLTFLKADIGRYKGVGKKVSPKAKQRFDTLFKELNYELHGVHFDHIMNDKMYEDLKQTAFYATVIGQRIDLSGSSMSNIRTDRDAFEAGTEKMKKFGFDVFGKDGEQKTAIQLAMQEIYDKWYAVQDDIAAEFAKIGTDYIKQREEENRENADSDEEGIGSAAIGEHIKESYEFNPFESTTARVRFFFATIPDVRKTKDGKFRFHVNDLGLPHLIPVDYAFNDSLATLCHVDSLDEFVQTLNTLASMDPMYKIILKNINEILNRRVVNGKVDADIEAFLTQLMTTIRKNRYQFMIVRSITDWKDGGFRLSLETSDAQYNARYYPLQWSQVLSKGGTQILKVNENGQLVFNPNQPAAAQMFYRISKLFSYEQKNGDKTIAGLKQMLSEIGMQKNSGYYMTVNVVDEEKTTADKIAYKKVTIDNLSDNVQLQIIKDKIVEALNYIGINMHSDEFDYMLKQKYGSTDVSALRSMFESKDRKDSMESFIYFLENISDGRKLNLSLDGQFMPKYGRPVRFDSIYESMAFVKNLGDWKYQYRHSHDLLNVLAVDGNRYYEMAENDYQTDVLRGLNKRGQIFDDLKQDPYNFYIAEDEKDALNKTPIYGSRVLTELSVNPDIKLSMPSYIGFKTDKKGDAGQDYFETVRREDYLAKSEILAEGGILSLTMSDKKKFRYLQGVRLPGLNYDSATDTEGNRIPVADFAKQVPLRPDAASHRYTFQQRDDVVDQMLSYAKSEYESVKRAGQRIDELERTGKKASGIVNYDTAEQGAKFSSLLGVYEETYNKDGVANGEQFISFNDGSKSWYENLAIAEAYFFSRPVEEQRALIAKNLQHLLDDELKTALELGLIEKVRDTGNPYLDYKNKGLDKSAISLIQQAYRMNESYAKVSDDYLHSIAVVVYLNDVSNKAVMSGQEMERLFYGNPAFYKHKYNDKGELSDRTTDEIKRLGGNGSTGLNNFLDLAQIPDKYKKDGVFTGKYVVAEINDEEVGSTQAQEMSEKMYEGQFRSMAYKQELDIAVKQENEEYAAALLAIHTSREMTDAEKDSARQEESKRHLKELQKIENSTMEEIDKKSVKQLEEIFPQLSAIAKIKADNVSDALYEEINVANGAAYISDEMCEMLLRMVGSYSKDVEQAFDILRGRTKADYLGISEAYQKVVTTVIGNQKYTAFGRMLLGNTSVPYYHKMALFPIFDCVATGKLRNIFDKMKQQKIDMLLMNSAVKVGSMGSQAVDWSKYNDGSEGDTRPVFKDVFNFNTYELDFAYLRKQLNTDPNEKEMMRMGTQAQKIIFSNLYDARDYVQRNGDRVKGRDLKDRVMHSMQALSQIGVEKLNQRFFVTNEDGKLIDSAGNVITDPNSELRQLDIKKFSKEVSRMMSDRGADKNIMRALELVNEGRDNEGLSVPLGAISNAAWLESVLISMINKDVIDVNTPGAFFIQRSVWAMEGSKMFDHSEGGVLGAQLYDGKELKMLNDKNSMDCVLSLDFFSKILPKVPKRDEGGHIIYRTDDSGHFELDDNGNRIPVMEDMSFNDAKDWLISNKVIGEDADPNIISYRIPTQAQSSIQALRCVDVLPVVRDTVILPKEFTEITGSDRYQCSNLKKPL